MSASCCPMSRAFWTRRGCGRQRTGAVKEAEHIQQGHKEHQLAVKLCPDGELLLGRVGRRRAWRARADDAAGASLSRDQPIGIDAVVVGLQVVKRAVITSIVEERIRARLVKRGRRLAQPGVRRARGAAAVQGHRARLGGRGRGQICTKARQSRGMEETMARGAMQDG